MFLENVHILMIHVIFLCVLFQVCSSVGSKSTSVGSNSLWKINNLQNDWVAVPNEFLFKNSDDLKSYGGVKDRKESGYLSSKNTKRVRKISYRVRNIPENFDSRDEWSNCTTINSITSQGKCGADWANAAAAVFSDRLCISTKGRVNVNISAQNLLACCSDCTNGNPGCSAGFVDEAFRYIEEYGLVTGGDYNSGQGCQPYEFPPCDGPCKNEKSVPSCKDYKCTNNKYKTVYDDDLHRGDNYYSLNASQVQNEIIQHGPVVATLDVYKDFTIYGGGVYRHVEGNFIFKHNVRLVGWGVTNDSSKTPFWTAANTWSRKWGENGFFRILRGSNECGIENEFVAGLPYEK